MKHFLFDPDQMRRQFRIDAAETAFFERELQHVYTRTYDVKYPELMGRMLVPVISEAGKGATSVNYRQFDRVGKAKIIGGQMGNDIPYADVTGKEFIRPVRTVALGYKYTLMELRQAAMANRPLSAMRATAARRGVEEILEEVALFGSPVDGISMGFLNHTSVPVTAAGAPWTTLTADEIIAMVAGALGRIDTATKGIEKPDTILLPTAVRTFIATKPRSTNSDKTILKFILEEFPEIKRVIGWWRLNTAGAGGVTRMVTYKLDPEKLHQEIPSDFEQLPVQQAGLEFKVPCIANTAGTAIPYPLSVDFLDGI